MSIEDKIKKGQQDFVADGGDWDEKLSQLEERFEKNRKKKLGFNWGPLLLGFILTVGIIGAIWYFTMGQKDTNENMYIAYFQPAPPVFDTGQRNVTDKPAGTDAKTQGNQAYLDGNYALAYNQWKKALVLNKDDDELKTFIGITSLSLNKTEEGIMYLSQVEHPDYQDMSQWYLALAHLKLGQVDKSLDILKNIAANTKHYKSKDAQEMVSKLG